MGKSCKDHQLPRPGTPYLLGRLVFTLTRMTSQPSLLNMGTPVSLSCKSRSVAVMLRTTLISMLPPVKLESQAGSTLHISATGASIPTLFAHTQNLRRQRAGSTPTWGNPGWGVLTATQPTFPFPLRQSMNSYTSETLLSCDPLPRLSLTFAPTAQSNPLQSVPHFTSFLSMLNPGLQSTVYLRSQHPHNEQPVLSDYIWKG